MNDIIDVSRYQGNVEWTKVAKAGIGGAILKTVSTNKSYGGIYIDPMFEKNYWAARTAGIPTGAYYYTYAQDKATADKELEKFYTAVEGKTFELPLIVDVEDNKLKPLSKEALTDLVEYSANTIESWGVYAMVYTYLSYQRTELNMARLSQYDLWLAAYRSTRPSSPAHGMWQYTSNGSVDGISGSVDMSHVYKNYPSIIKKAGLTTPKKKNG